MRPYALIAGGGTGGHVYPALAIADALVARGHEKESIEFVGSARALEARVVPEAGYKITLLPGRGIKRSLHPDNVGAVAGLIVAAVRAAWLVARRRPSVVVSVGGYAAAPAGLAAALLRVPMVIAESNAVPGATNRLLGRWSKAAAVAWPNTPLPQATVTGNPVRPEIVAVDRSPEARRLAKQQLGIDPDRVLVGVFGGSLGSRTINKAVVELVARWRGRSDVAVYHVVGRRDYADAQYRSDLPAEKAGLSYVAVEYETEMARLYAAADVMICRSGATTAAELATAGTPALLVPLPGAPGDHQTANARVLEQAGGAVLVLEQQCTGEHLDTVLTPLLRDSERRVAMQDALKSLGAPDAADRVAEIVERSAY